MYIFRDFFLLAGRFFLIPNIVPRRILIRDIFSLWVPRNASRQHITFTNDIRLCYVLFRRGIKLTFEKSIYIKTARLTGRPYRYKAYFADVRDAIRGHLKTRVRVNSEQ